MEIQENQSQPNLSEHEAAMVAKVDENEQKTQESMKPDSDIEPSVEENKQEELYAGKYKSVEEMEKAYKELESKLGNNDDNQVQETKEDKEAETSEPQTTDEAKEIAEAKGIDYAKLETEFNDNGSLSEETYQSLADKGIPKEMVDSYIAGQQAIVTQAQVKLQAIAGGEEGYNQMISWASENLSEAEKSAFNGSLGNEAQAEFAIKGLYAQYKATLGPSLVKPGESAPQGTRGYQSKAEMTADMHNPRYKTDPAFRAMVSRKIAQANF